MSWNGTLTCSYCYERGHSKRKCPEMKKNHDEYVKLTEAGEPVNWRQRSAHDEYKEMQESLKESNKVCAFCQSHGHRVLTCPDRLGRVEQLRKINKVYKPLLRKTLKEVGFGKGSLVSIREWVVVKGEHVKRDVPYMVKSVQRGALDFCNLREGFGNITVVSMIDMRERAMRMPHSVTWAITQAVCHLDDHSWGETNYSSEARQHPFQSKVRGVNKPETSDILAHSDDLFCTDFLCHPIEKKSDINKMFREAKKRSDSGRFYTEEYTHNFVGEMFSKLKELKGWKL